MPTQITDAGASLQITTGTQTRNVMKSQIIEVAVIKTNIIKINIGQGALYNIFITFTDVNTPLMSSPEELKDWLVSICQLTINVSGGGGSTTDTALLQAISGNTTLMATLMEIFEEPVFTDDSNPNCVYKAYGNIGLGENQPVYAIKRIIQENDIIKVQWPDGVKNFNRRWTDRATLNYL